MHKGKTLEAYKVWKRIRGVDSIESKEEFFVMKASVEEEEGEVAQKATGKFPWMDFIRYIKCFTSQPVSNASLLEFPAVAALSYTQIS